MSAPRKTPHFSSSKLRWAGSVAALGLLLSGCSAGGGSAGADGNEEVTLTLSFWGDASRSERYEEAIDLFESENENVTIQTTFAGFGDYWTARNTEAAGGSLPDVIQMDLAYINQYASTNQLVPLNDYIGDVINTADINETLAGAGEVEGETYAIASAASTLSTLVNDPLLAELGVEAPSADLTWDEYDDFLAEVSEAGASRDPQVYGAMDYTAIFWGFQMWLQQEGLEFVDENGELGFTPEDLERWWARGEALREANAVIPPERLEQLQGVDALGSGEVASDISWDNFLVRFSEGPAQPELSMLPLPVSDSGDRSMFLKPGLMMAIGANSEHPDEAAAFIDFLINSPEVGEIFGASRGVPSSGTAVEGMAAEGLDAQLVEYEASIEEDLTGAAPPPVEGLGSMEEAFVRIHQDLAFDAVDASEAAQLWFDEAESALGQS